MATTNITLNLRKRLLKVHMTQRRKRVSRYAREAIAKFAKADIDKIRFDSDLNRHLIARISRKPVSFKVSVEKLDDIVKVRLAGVPKNAFPATKVSDAKATKAAAPKAEAKAEVKEKKAAAPAKAKKVEASEGSAKAAKPD
jgi:ribosomal protein L31E